MYWDGGLLSRAQVRDQARQRTELQNAAILITDLSIEDPRDLIPTLAACVQQGVEDLAIIARKISDVTIGMLELNRERVGQDHAVGIRRPAYPPGPAIPRC